MKKRSYYDRLNVKPSASPDEIKNAFRKKAKETHPDHHPGDEGKKVEFQELSMIYSTLSDPRSRAYYDEHGEEPKLDNTHTEAVEMLVHLFTTMRSEFGEQIFFQDVVGELKRAIKQIEKETQEEIKQTQKSIEQVDKLAIKLKYKKQQSSFMHMALEKEKQHKQNTILNKEHGLEVFSKALSLVDDYQFEADKKSMQEIKYQSESPFFITIKKWQAAT